MLGDCCTTSVDCLVGLYCDPDAGVCIAPPLTFPAPSCLGVDLSCADGGTCCGVCRQGLCKPPASRCGTLGDPCVDSSECCDDFACTDTGAAPDGATSCTPTCGGFGASCVSAGGCCTHLGYVCTLNGTCGFPVASQYCSPVPCADGGEECTLGAWCDPGVIADPCKSAGLVCDGVISDGFFRVAARSCRLPEEGEACQPGGPPCHASSGSTQTPVCGTDAGPDMCVQPCRTNTDCPSTVSLCDGELCHTVGCSPPFSECSLGGVGPTLTGVCLPDQESAPGWPGVCYQTASSGGGPGDLCDWNATRQSGGGLCDKDDVCYPFSGLCEPLCNAGQRPLYPRACAPDRSCLFSGGSTQDDDAVGACVTLCDPTDDGGGCVSAPGKPPQKCEAWAIPICVAAAANPLDGGDLCDPTTNIDPCREGTACLGPLGPAAEFRCLKFCDQPAPGGGPSKLPCPMNLTCNLAAGREQFGYCY
jgi:hypothetical protein